MSEAFKAFWEFLGLLVHPGSKPFLIAFTAVLTVAATVAVAGLLLMAAAWGEDERFNKARKFGTVWIHLMGGPKNPAELVTAAAATPAIAAATEKLPFRKLLYVKVIYLTKEADGVPPVYVRNVERLAEEDRAVKVYDEAMYYTLKRFPMQQPVPAETDSSSGIVDSRLLIPWTDIDMRPFAYRDLHSLEIKSDEASDTLCSVSHFFNGLQKSSEQNFCTFADQDAATLSIVVDFSSIPDAATRVTLKQAFLVTGTRNTNVPYKRDGDVYSVQYEHAKKDEMLRMDFTFSDWGQAQKA